MADRRPDLDGGIRIREPLRHHTDDRPRLAVEQNRSANDRRIAAEAAAPQVPAQDGGPASARAVLPSSERAAVGGLNAQRREQIPGASGTVDAFRQLPVRTRQVVRSATPDRHLLERRRAALPRLEHSAGDDVVWISPVAADLAEHHELIGIAERQRRQQHGAHEREERRVRADPEGQRERGDDAEPGIPEECTSGISHVARDIVEPAEAERVAAAILDQRHGAQRAKRGRPRIRRIHPGGHVLGRLFLNMKPQLGIELPLDPPPPE